MDIDKFIPRQLNTDADQRLLQEGEMVDAVNVSVQEDGNGSAGVLKNVRGTRAMAYNNLNDVIPTDALTVIGSVSDSQRSRIYFFAANNDNAGFDYIYMLDTITDQYQIVFQTTAAANGFLNFDPNSFIKADVVNRDFSRDGNLESVLYWTDNINPPRKINVDRAISGEYDGFNFVELDFMLNSIKAAPTREPAFVFDTDENFRQNNFQGKCFQFATQFVYADGEESAVSPYSGIAFVDTAIESSTTESYAPVIYSSLLFQNNVIDINTKFVEGSYSGQSLNPNADIPDVVDIRILARENDNGAWFVIDDVPVREDAVREINGVATTVFNGDTGVYRWYNNGGYRTVPSITTDKLFDNVPLLSRGQTVAGNRLVYSNYEEGYDNGVEPSVNITVNYLDGGVFDSDETTTTTDVVSFITEDVPGVTSSVNDDGSIAVDFVSAFSGATDQSYALNANSVTTISFNWNVDGSLSINTTDPVVEFTGIDSDGDVVSGKYQPAVFDDSSDQQYWSVYFTYVAEEGDTIATLANAFSEWVSDQIWSYTFVNPSTSIGVNSGTNVSSLATFPFILSDASHTVGWRFITVSTAGSVYIQPYIYVYTINHPDLYQVHDAGGGGQFDPEGGLDNGWWALETQQDNVSIARYQDYTGHVYTWGGGTGVSNVTFSSNSVNTIQTFKHGAAHEFAVMYYDKYNRNGPLMKIGSTYVQHPAERTGSELGPATITFDFNHEAPDWAESYKILYPGNSSFSSVWTGTVQGAFVEYHQESHGAYTGVHVAENKRHIYLSIEGNEELNQEYGTKTSYDFSEGDILRVISYNNDGAADTLAESSNPSSPIVEFKVVKTVTLDTTDNPLKESEANDQALEDAGKTGRFVVVEAPWIDASVLGPNGNAIQYHGFDWFSLTNTAYPYNDATGDQVLSSGENRWKKQCAVEILTPTNMSEKSVYYEITDYRGVGLRRDAAPGETNHGAPFTINRGDVFYRPVISSVPIWNGATWEAGPKGREVRTKLMESDRFSDFRDRIDWGKGRPHFALTEDQNRRRYNGITFSEAIVDDLDTNYLSSFDKNQANFLDLNSNFGAVNYVSQMGEVMIAIQENKVSRLTVGRNIVSQADGSDGLLGLSSLPFNVDIYFSGDYGCGDNPESVLVQDNQVFFADVSRARVLRLASSQLYPISEKGTSSLFADRFNTYNAYAGNDARIVSGYDPSVDRYYVTFNMGDDSDTIGYDVFGGNGGNGAWVSRYTFYPTNYSNQNNLMYSTLWNDPDPLNNDFDQQLFWAHDSNVYNAFYGQLSDESVVEFVSKISPSVVKVFDAISYEGNSNVWEVTNITTNLNAVAGALPWDEREGSYYAYITRDENGTKNVTMVGVVESSTNQSITFQNRINNVPIQANAALLSIVNGVATEISTTNNNVQVGSLTDAFTIATLGNNVDTGAAANGAVIVAQTIAAADSDPVRGHWAQIRMTNQQATQHELYCVNTVITPSPMYHARG